MKLRIRYSDFWPGFNGEEFLLTHLLRELTQSNLEIVMNNNEFVDLEFFSRFSFSSTTEKLFSRLKGGVNHKSLEKYILRSEFGFDPQRRTNQRYAIWYTGENLRPPYGYFDGYISFEKQDKINRNIYFPYWMTRLDWGFPGKPYEIMPKPKDLTKNRKGNMKRMSVCTFSSNATTLRGNIIKSVEGIYPFKGYGKAFNNSVSTKMSVSEFHMFQICNENDIYPGYVTEKLQEAWSMFQVPIWAGLHIDDTFNEGAYIDVTNLTAEEIKQKFQILTPEDIIEMQERPLLNTTPTLDNINTFLKGFIY